MYIQLSRLNRQKNFFNTIPIILNAWYSYNWVYHDGALSYWMVGMMLYTVYIVMMRWWCNPIELDTQTYVCRRYRSLFSIISLLDVVVRPPIYLYLRWSMSVWTLTSVIDIKYMDTHTYIVHILYTYHEAKRDFWSLLYK
jgi:hypothetical protein